ncbi:MAG: NADH-quinone oxidoreductase subunit N [Caldilineaceae bacterium]
MQGGTTNLRLLAESLQSPAANQLLLLPGMALIIVGFGFKVSLVPFHMWTPDVYQETPTPVTAFAGVGTKTAAFAAFIRVFTEALPAQQETWGWMLAALAVVTMTVGNLAALRQPSVKRMLAYSSVAHAGYLLVALVPASAEGAGAALFYVFAYAFMNIGAFAVLIALEKAGEGDVDQERFNGLGSRMPWLALAMAIFMFSLSGIRRWPASSASSSSSKPLWTVAGPGWPWWAWSTAPSAPTTTCVSSSPYFSEGERVERQQWTGLNVSLAVAAIGTVVVGLYPTFWTNLLMHLGG